jgi:DNA replication protein DnaC
MPRMLNDLHQHLDALKLRKISELIEQHLARAQKEKLSYSAFLLELLRQEVHDKRERAIQNRIRLSGMPERWMLDTYPFHLQKGINRRQHEEFAELDFLERAENIVWIGPTGVGKSGLSGALLHKALLSGRTGRCLKAQDLFDELGASVADRSTQMLLHRLAKLDVLLVDELGYVNPKPDQVNQFFRLIDKRRGKRSTLITTNLGYQEWSSFLGNPNLTAALLNRLMERVHTITFGKNPVNLVLHGPKNAPRTSATPPSSKPTPSK